VVERLPWQTGLREWFRRVGRDLPWRRTRDPYAIWVSEVMLQQTQVATVIPYWERWMARFPDVSALAASTEAEVLEQWQGLGYYRRARLLHQGARFVAEHGLPRTAPDWQRVPGVGRYTAGAIASIALGEPAALVDGNVERVYARFRGDEAAGPPLTRQAWGWAEANVDPHAPGEWNQALMELGATVCRPVAPRCGECPLRADCVAHRDGTADRLPRSLPRREVVRLRQHVIVPIFDGRFGLRPIVEGPWWVGMWEFPRAESRCALEALLGPGEDWLLSSVRHAVTHHRIELLVSARYVEEPTTELHWLGPSEVDARALPAPQRRIWQAVQRGLLPEAASDGSVK
jgi:A/G-specific adenine glycosylase